MPSKRLAAILALDVVGYSRMTREDADALLASLNAMYRAVVKPAVATTGAGSSSCWATAR